MSKRIDDSNPCAMPAAASEFSATDSRVYGWFTVLDAKVGDLARRDWIDPEGLVYASSAWAKVSANGRWCASTWMAISGWPPASKPGVWRLKVYWNEEPLFALPFRIGPAPEGMRVTTGGIVNAASFKGGYVSPGELVTIFGSDLGPAALTGARLTADGLVDTMLEETRVLFDSQPAPLIYVARGQLSAVAPFGLAGRPSTEVVVQHRGRQSAPVIVGVSPSNPGIFTSDASGRRQIVALNEDGTLNSASRPASRGSVVTFYATGGGAMDPDVADGRVRHDPLPSLRLPVAVEIDGAQAELLYAGQAPPAVAGVLQVNVRIPEGIAGGAETPIVVKIGDAASQSSATIAVEAALPDLVITDFTAGTSVVVGGNLTGMRMQVSNQGQGHAAAFRVGFYLSPTSEVSTRSVSLGLFCPAANGLRAGQAATCSGALTVPGTVPAGVYYLAAIADDLSQVKEASESNNVRLSAAGAITVSRPVGRESFTVSGQFSIAGVTLPGTVTMLWDGDGYHCAITAQDGGNALTLMFNDYRSFSGSSITFNRPDLTFAYLILSGVPRPITAATFTLTAPSTTAGTIATGALSLSAGGTTVNGTLSGRIAAL